MPLRARQSVRVPLVFAILFAGCGPGAIAAPPSSFSALAAFERFRAMEGAWEGRSTKGWQESISFKTIAGGSAVVETSFDAHPGETMLTVFHLDAEDLTLTHYCVAKNQPRLRATEISADGRTITFTFAGGGNLADRNRGHMDSAVFRFEDADHVSSRWTWYQDGKERWLEEIRLERRPKGR
jgi:GH24 family phage-related lysozyme (muramidase)